jgi:hypothetical protein
MNKKIYLLLCAALLTTGIKAQQTLKVKFNKNGSDRKISDNLQRNGAGNSVQQLATTVIVNNGYVPNTTMNINFTIRTTNTDAEYIDSIAFTFPATFTVNTSPNASFPTADATFPAATLNGVTGQTISWGANANNQMGGIWANPAQTFDINVSVDPSVTGNQWVHYYASGDTYGTSPGDFSDSVLITEMMTMDAKLVGLGNIGVSCSLSNAEVITAMVKNYGIDTIRGFTASYKINGGTAVVENPTDTILPGDTLTYNFTTTANLSAPGAYHIWVNTTALSDGNPANDSGAINTENYTATDIHVGPESIGFESTDSLALTYWTIINGNNDAAVWAVVNTYNHSGSRCLRKAGSGPAGDDDWLITNCLTLQGGTPYALDYYYKNFELVTPCSLEVYVGSGTTIAAMTQSVVVNPVPTDTTYQHVVVFFTPSTTGTYNFGFHAYSTSGSSSLRLDDINISESAVGVKENPEAKNLNVYPNPNMGLCYVTTSLVNAQVEIFNLVGERVFFKSQLNKGTNTLDITSLPEGSYIVRIVSGKEISTKKIVVSK